jgi:hypothetical protein
MLLSLANISNVRDSTAVISVKGPLPSNRPALHLE